MECRGLAPASLDDYLRIFERVAIGAFGGEVLPAPEDAHTKLAAHLYRLLEEGYSPVTLRNHLAVAKYYFEALGRPELLAHLKVPVRVKKQLTQTLLEHEVVAVLKALKKIDPRTKDVFEVALLTGLRLSEILTLKYTKDDLAAQRVLVKGPSGQPRPVFLGTKAAGILEARLPPRKRFPKHANARLELTAQLREAAKTAGVENVTSSRLRMTYAVRMLMAGHDFEFVAKNLGLDRSSVESRRRLKEVLVDHLTRVNHA